MWSGEKKGELIRQISFEEPTTPRRLNPTIPTDLETIVLKAISKNPSDRYDHAHAFADDLQFFLGHKPIVARRPTLLQRSTKWAYRNQQVVAASLVVLLLATIGLAVSNVLILRQKAIADQETAIAEAINDFVNNDLLGKADPHDEPNRDLTVGELLDRAMHSIEGQFVDQPLVEAGIRTTIGRSLLNLGRHDDAERQAIEIRNIFLDAGLDSTDRRILNVEHALAWILHERGQYERSLRKMEPLLDTCKQHLGMEDRLTLEIAADVADLRRHVGQYTQAEQQLQEIIAIQKREFGADDDETIASRKVLAHTIGDQGRHGEAEQILRETYEILDRKHGPEHPRTLSAQLGLAQQIALQGRFAEAEPHCREAYEIRRKVLGVSNRQTISCLLEFAHLLRLDAQNNEAEALLRDSIEELAKTVGNEDSQVIELRKELARVLIWSDQFTEAEQHYRELRDDGYLSDTWLISLYKQQLKFDALEGFYRDEYEKNKNDYGPEHLSTLESLNDLAGVVHDQGRYEEAERLFQKLVDIRTRVLGEENLATLKVLRDLAGTLVQLGRGQDATRIYQRILEAQKRQLRPNHPDTLLTMNELAVVFWRNDQLDKSIPIFEKLAHAIVNEKGPNHPDALIMIGNLGINQKDAGRFDDAIRHLERVHEKIGWYPFLLFSTEQLIDAYVKSGDNDKAEELVPEFLKRVREKLPKIEIAQNLGMLARDLYLPTEQFDEAEEVLRESLSIYEQEMPDDWRKHVIGFRLGIALLGQKEVGEAEKMLSEGFAGITRRTDVLSQRDRNDLIESIDLVTCRV